MDGAICYSDTRTGAGFAVVSRRRVVALSGLALARVTLLQVSNVTPVSDRNRDTARDKVAAANETVSQKVSIHARESFMSEKIMPSPPLPRQLIAEIRVSRVVFTINLTLANDGNG